MISSANSQSRSRSSVLSSSKAVRISRCSSAVRHSSRRLAPREGIAVVADVSPGTAAQTVGAVVQAVGEQAGATGVIGAAQRVITGATGSSGLLPGLLEQH